jgi:class 3 adenylate cyclase
LKSVSARSRALAAALRRRERLPLARREALDRRTHARLGRELAVVYTDTDDFTVRVARHGMLHFLMVFARGIRAIRPAIARNRGRLVKVEADSLLLVFPDAVRAYRAVIGMTAALARANRARPRSERTVFSFGVGFGPMLDLGHDVLGLEVNLASKLGEDLARPGEVLFTEAAVAGLPREVLARVEPHGTVRFTGRPTRVLRLRSVAG